MNRARWLSCFLWVLPMVTSCGGQDGNSTGDGAAVLTSTGDQGNDVVQMITNYQNQGVQENGYLRVLLFRPQLRRVEVTTYSPWTDTHHTDPDNQLTITDVSFFP